MMKEITKEFSTKEQIEEEFSISYIDTICFENDDVLQKVKKRANRKRFHLYDKKHNKWMSNLYARDVRNKKHAPVCIKKVNPLVGHGVFAKETIPSLSYVGEYTGMLRKRRGKKDKGNDYIFGYMVGFFGTPFIIDAKDMGNFTRFLNHSFNANVSSRGIVVDGVYHVIFFANKLIKKGEQLTYDYGPTYWNKRPYPQSL